MFSLQNLAFFDVDVSVPDVTTTRLVFDVSGHVVDGDGAAGALALVVRTAVPREAAVK